MVECVVAFARGPGHVVRDDEGVDPARERWAVLVADGGDGLGDHGLQEGWGRKHASLSQAEETLEMTSRSGFRSSNRYPCVLEVRSAPEGARLTRTC